LRLSSGAQALARQGLKIPKDSSYLTDREIIADSSYLVRAEQGLCSGGNCVSDGLGCFDRSRRLRLLSSNCYAETLLRKAARILRLQCAQTAP
jgi:hypothetical protein